MRTSGYEADFLATPCKDTTKVATNCTCAHNEYLHTTLTSDDRLLPLEFNQHILVPQARLIDDPVLAMFAVVG